MYLSEILPGNWREGEWPEHIEVSHESSRFKSRRYVPRVNSVNKSSANPVDGIWCSHCGWAGVIAQDEQGMKDERAGLDVRIRGGVGLYCHRTRMRI